MSCKGYPLSLIRWVGRNSINKCRWRGADRFHRSPLDGIGAGAGSIATEVTVTHIAAGFKVINTAGCSTDLHPRFDQR